MTATVIAIHWGQRGRFVAHQEITGGADRQLDRPAGTASGPPMTHEERRRGDHEGLAIRHVNKTALSRPKQREPRMCANFVSELVLKDWNRSNRSKMMECS